MISSHSTNFLYLADTLPTKYPAFFRQLEKTLIENNVQFDLIPETKDVWAVDYMPIQVSENKFVRFTYDPKYLKSEVYKKTISYTAYICKTMGIETIKSDIILDGGNIVSLGKKAIMTDRIFVENRNYKRNDLIDEFKSLLELEHLVIVPAQPYDFTGHVDGMMRFVNENTVLLNDYTQESNSFKKTLSKALKSADLESISFPYPIYENKNSMDAKGAYINFLQMEKIIIAPIFDLKEDELAINILKANFPKHKIVPLNCNELAKDGGILNCISWNILKK